MANHLNTEGLQEKPNQFGTTLAKKHLHYFKSSAVSNSTTQIHENSNISALEGSQSINKIPKPLGKHKVS